MLDRFFRILSKCPDVLHPPIYWFLRACIVLFGKSEKRRFHKNVKRVYNLPSQSVFSKMFLNQCIHHQVTCQLETILGIYNPSKIKVSGLDQLRTHATQLLDAGNGLVITTAHLGSWEFVAKYTGESVKRPFHALAKPSKYPMLTDFLGKMRQRMNTKVLWTGKSSLLKDMIKTVRGGHILGFVMDQKPAGRIGPKVQFLGQSTEFVTGPASVALKCKAPILSVYCLRVRPWTYRIESRVLYQPSQGSHELSVDQLTAELAEDMSKMVQAYPEQWTWSYKRWSDA